MLSFWASQILNSFYLSNMKRIVTIVLLALTVCACSRKPAQMSGNPLFEGWYADPEGIVFGNECWIYPT